MGAFVFPFPRPPASHGPPGGECDMENPRAGEPARSARRASRPRARAPRPPRARPPRAEAAAPTPPPPSPTRRAASFSAARTRTRASALCAPSGWRARRTSARSVSARVPVGGGHRGPLEGQSRRRRRPRASRAARRLRGERRARVARASRSHVADQASNAARVALAFARRRARERHALVMRRRAADAVPRARTHRRALFSRRRWLTPHLAGPVC